MKTNKMKSQPLKLPMILAATASALALSSCGKDAGNVTLQSDSLAVAGTPARTSTLLAAAQGFNNLMTSLLGIRDAFAAVSPYTSFKACNDTLQFYNDKGEQLTIGGSQNISVGQGLMDFSPGSSPVIGSVEIPEGTAIKEVDITFAVVPSVCAGANYAVQFDPGTGPINITQNTAFKFKFANPLTVQGQQSITLMFSSIVQAMIGLGANLDNSTIQTINVGQAQ